MIIRIRTRLIVILILCTTLVGISKYGLSYLDNISARNFQAAMTSLMQNSNACTPSNVPKFQYQ